MYREVRKTMHIDDDVYRKSRFSIHRAEKQDSLPVLATPPL